jgi:hypothetical protein
MAQRYEQVDVNSRVILSAWEDLPHALRRIVGFLKIEVRPGIADKTWCLHSGNKNVSSRGQ